MHPAERDAQTGPCEGHQQSLDWTSRDLKWGEGGGGVLRATLSQKGGVYREFRSKGGGGGGGGVHTPCTTPLDIQPWDWWTGLLD